MAQRPSGWYDDPDDSTQLRYFDGILWTERRTPKLMPGLAESTIGSPPRPDAEQPHGGSSTGGAPTAPGAGAGTPSGTPTREQNPWQAPPQGGAGRAPGGHQPGQWPAGPGRPAQHPERPPVPTTPDGRPISGWWRRFGAYVVDGMLILVVSSIASWPWSQSWFETYADYARDVTDAQQRGLTRPSAPEALQELPWQWLLIFVALLAVYEIGFTVWRGQTVGKMITGISVRQLEHATLPTLSEAAVRFLVKGIAFVLAPITVLSGLGTLFTVADGLWPLGDRNRQALHDKAPGTVVVVGRVHRQSPLQ
ncbi:RDD family protein [Luteipulveratus sp. YIM 133132]|uniref:RDD family protein n=1 Tax=Luteipulveratus flavus TaxID=3031728 RepID=UPI0023AFD189|nr:RDD family protein [Luteipulveratus sp. YIM 133132]MDE9367813.1 RDD family protein [Luteipulveratus sp. YIM 133132]